MPLADFNMEIFLCCPLLSQVSFKLEERLECFRFSKVAIRGGWGVNTKRTEGTSEVLKYDRLLSWFQNKSLFSKEKYNHINYSIIGLS